MNARVLAILASLSLACGSESPTDASATHDALPDAAIEKDAGTEMDAAELDAAEMDATEMDATELDATEMDAAELDAAEMDATEMDAAEMDAAEMDATEMDAAEMDAGPRDASGCEPRVRCGTICTSTASDLDNCGACGTLCDDAFNAAATCENGGCTRACVGTWGDCNGDLSQPTSDGCETDLAGDSANCGQCGNPCPNGEVCISPFACLQVASLGEDCGTALSLSSGANLEPHFFFINDYLNTLPSCAPLSGVSNGGDLVLSYQASVTGFAYVEIEKGFEYFTMVVSDAPCGTATSELACVSEIGGPSIGSLFPTVAGTTYTIYLINTHLNSFAELPNPLAIDVVETDCSTAPAPSVTSLSPQNGTTTADLVPILTATFDEPVRDDAGILTLTGDLGTSISYDLSTAPTEVSFSPDHRTITIDPGLSFPAGEQIAVTWTLAAHCGGAVAPASWTFTLPSPPCQPGIGGVVGAQTSSVAGNIPFVSLNYFVITDSDPLGWVYFGSTFSFFRVSKDGAIVEDVMDPSRAGSFPSGRTGLVEGGSVFAVPFTNNTALPVTNRILRLTDDGGQTWGVQDMARWSTTAPADRFAGIAIDLGRIHLITKETSPTAATEIWSFDPNDPALPAEAALEAVVFDATRCSGLAMDSIYYYTACELPVERIVRIDRTTLATTDLITLDVSLNANAVVGDDLDGDSIFDVLYVQTLFREGYYVCDPAGATPYSATHFRFRNGVSSAYGLALDPSVSVLWMFDWEYRDLWRIE